MKLYGIKYVFGRLQTFFLSLVVIWVAFIFLNLIFSQYFDSAYQTMSVKDLVGNTDMIFQLEPQNHDMKKKELEKIDCFVNDMGQVPGLLAYGRYSMYIMVFNEIEQSSEGGETLLIMNKELLPLTNIIDYDNLGKEREGMLPVLAGEKYRKSLEVGQVLSSPFMEQKFYVAGFIDEKARWLSDSLFYSENSTINLEDKMIVLSDKSFSSSEDYIMSYINNIYLKVNSDTEAVLSEVYALSKQYGVTIKCHTVTDMIKEYQNDNKERLLFISVITLVISIVTLLSVSMVNVINYFYRKREIAIMLCVGFSTRRILFYLLLENGIKIVVGFIGSFLVTSVLRGSIYNADWIRENFIQRQVVVCMLIYGGLLILSSFLVMHFVLARQGVQKLLGGNYHD